MAEAKPVEKKQPLARIGRFFREVRAELKKVTWPTQKELISYTVVVLVSVFLMAGLIWVVDSGFSLILQALLLK